MLTRHDDVWKVARDNETFINGKGVAAVPFEESRVRPVPAVADPPVPTGGTGRAALRRAARHGFWHATSMPPDEVAADRAKLAAVAAGHGRPVPGTSFS